nr:nuclear transport factor 2 family protein [uncultured Ottowia sp.]
MTDAEFIYARWHEAARSRDVPALLALYAEDAELESPLVPVILNRASGVLRGHAQIREFLEEGTRRRPNEFVRWHRDGRFLSAGGLLVWEYPRATPQGEQIDILEFMELQGRLIQRHRIYWGWFGTQTLIASALRKQAQAPSEH